MFAIPKEYSFLFQKTWIPHDLWYNATISMLLIQVSLKNMASIILGVLP